MTTELPPIPPTPEGGWPALTLRLERLHPEALERTPHGHELIAVATTAVRLARTLSVGVTFSLCGVDLVAFPQQTPDNVATTWARLIRHCPPVDPHAGKEGPGTPDVLELDPSMIFPAPDVLTFESPPCAAAADKFAAGVGMIAESLAPGGADAPPALKTQRLRDEAERLRAIVCARVGVEITRHAEQAARLNMDLWVGRPRLSSAPVVGYDRNGADLYKVELPFMFLIPGQEPVAEPGRWTGFFLATNRIDEPLPDMLSDSPPDRWSIRRKAELIDATRKGIVSVERAQSVAGISPEEWASWVAAYDEHGPDGLKVSAIQGDR